MSVPRLPWKRASDLAVEAALDRFDDVMDVVLQRWRAAEIAKVDLAWEKIVPLLPDDRAMAWLDNLMQCVRSGASWSPTFPLKDTAPEWPQTEPGMTFKVKSDTCWTPARMRRRALYEDAQKMFASGDMIQKDIAAALGVSQATVSQWLRRGI